MPKQAAEDGHAVGHPPLATSERPPAYPTRAGRSLQSTPARERLRLVAALVGLGFAVLFVLNGFVNGWTAAYDLALTIASPWDHGRVRVAGLALPLSVAGWLLVPSLVGAFAGYVAGRTAGGRRPAAVPDVPAGEPAPPARTRSRIDRYRAGSVDRGAEPDRSAFRPAAAPGPAPNTSPGPAPGAGPAGGGYPSRGREIVAEARRAAELAQTLAELVAALPAPLPADSDVMRQITGRAEVALRIAEEMAMADPAAPRPDAGRPDPGWSDMSRRGGQLARELATLEHLIGRVPGQTPAVNQVCAALTKHLRHFRVQVEEFGAR